MHRSIAWVPNNNTVTNGAVRSRVYWPHEYLCKIGCNSKIISEPLPGKLDEFDVILFHRWGDDDLIDECVSRGKVVGLDVADAYPITSSPTFITTDSHANVRAYGKPNTFYWPHGFNMRIDERVQSYGRHFESGDGHTSFVYCGYCENVHCVHGSPYSGLAAARSMSGIDLTIISDLDRIPPDRLAGVSYVEWNMELFESMMMSQFHAGFFPQCDTPYYRAKSAYKAMHAASLGLPSILTANEEASAVFTDGENAIFAIDDEESWLQAIMSMLDPEYRHELAHKAEILIREQYSIKHMVQRLLTVISLYA